MGYVKSVGLTLFLLFKSVGLTPYSFTVEKNLSERIDAVDKKIDAVYE